MRDLGWKRIDRTLADHPSCERARKEIGNSRVHDIQPASVGAERGQDQTLAVTDETRIVGAIRSHHV